MPDALGIERAGFYAFRHTAASLMLQQSLDIVTVSLRPGHANPAITLRVYAHHIPGREREAAGAVEAALSGTGSTRGSTEA